MKLSKNQRNAISIVEISGKGFTIVVTILRKQSRCLASSVIMFSLLEKKMVETKTVQSDHII